MERNELILIGGGGHCKSCIDVIETQGKYKIAGILDKADKVGEKVLNYNIIGTDDQIPMYVKQGYIFLITVGHIQNSSIRKKLFDKVLYFGGKLATIISPLAHVSKYAKVGTGTIIMHHAIINAGTILGNNNIINTKALIEHDCKIANHTHIATASILNGACEISDGAFIGSNSVLKQGIYIGPNVFIGAGSVVTHNLTESGIYIGSPAKKIK